VTREAVRAQAKGLNMEEEEEGEQQKIREMKKGAEVHFWGAGSCAQQT